jgi:hypothetical protein
MTGVSRVFVPVEMDPMKLVGRGWKAWVWGAVLTSLGKLTPDGDIALTMTREKLRDLTGVPEKNQQRFERKIGVIARPNYAVTSLDPTKLDGIRDHLQHHAFVWHDTTRNKKAVGWRLPDTRVVPGLDKCNKGRTKSHNRKLAGLSYWDGPNVEPVRLFFKSCQRAVRSSRKHPNRDAYWPMRRHRRATAWAVIAAI